MKAVIRQLVEALDQSENMRASRVRFDGRAVEFLLGGDSSQSDTEGEPANDQALSDQLQAAREKVARLRSAG